MTLSRLQVEPLTEEAFAPFGKVIQKQGQRPEVINHGRTLKYARLADIDVDAQGGKPAVHLYCSNPVDLPLCVEIMECHPLGSQTFMPLHNRPFLVVVAPPGGEPVPGSIRCFITDGRQGVHLAKGVWHHSQLSLGEPADYLVIERDGAGDNTVERRLQQTLTVEDLPPGAAQKG
jgi:ureidoglycolate lyase